MGTASALRRQIAVHLDSTDVAKQVTGWTPPPACWIGLLSGSVAEILIGGEFRYVRRSSGSLFASSADRSEVCAGSVMTFARSTCSTYSHTVRLTLATSGSYSRVIVRLGLPSARICVLSTDRSIPFNSPTFIHCRTIRSKSSRMSGNLEKVE